jgi:hypothetical protein
VQQGKEIFKEAFGMADHNPVLKCYCMSHCESAAGGPMLPYFPDVYRWEKTCSIEAIRWCIDTYSFEEFNAPTIKIAGLDSLCWGNHSFVLEGDVSNTKHWFTKKANMISAQHLPTTPGLFIPGFVYGVADAHSLRSRAGLRIEATRLMKAWQLTFDEAESTSELFFTMSNGFYYQTESYSCFCPKFFCNQIKKRHWLLAPSDINLGAFSDWLPPPSAGASKCVIDVSCTSATMLAGGDSAEVFEALGEHNNGTVAANTDIINFPFNSTLQVQSFAALGRCNSELGRREEAKSAFENSVREANRCKIKLMELIYLKDYISTQLAPDSATAAAQELSRSLHGV